MAEHYTVRLDVRLTKNYNSMGAEVEYGRDLRPGENRDALVANVEAEVKKRLVALTEYVSDTLFEIAGTPDKKRKEF